MKRKKNPRMSVVYMKGEVNTLQMYIAGMPKSSSFKTPGEDSIDRRPISMAEKMIIISIKICKVTYK